MRAFRLRSRPVLGKQGGVMAQDPSGPTSAEIARARRRRAAIGKLVRRAAALLQLKGNANLALVDLGGDNNFADLQKTWVSYSKRPGKASNLGFRLEDLGLKPRHRTSLTGVEIRAFHDN